MISANEIRNKKIADASNGYDKMEVNILLDEASDTIDAYVRQNEDLYHKMEVLANKIEEYRAEEDLIKTAIIKAEKTAEEIRIEAKQKAEFVIKEASDKSTEILDAANAAKLEVEKAQVVANEQAEKIIATARETAAEIIRQKTEEGNAIVADAEKKANEAINSSKIVAQNILDQAKEISDDLVSKSKEEKEAYEILVNALKSDAKVFLENVKSLYNEQLEALNNAKLDHESEEKIESVENVNDLQEEVESLVSEMEEIESAIPSSITIDAPVADVQPEEESAEEEIFEEVFDEIEEVAEIEEEPEDTEFELNIEEIEEPVEETEETAQAVEFDVNENEPDFDEIDDGPVDPMDALKAFSQTPVEDKKDEDESLFDNNLPFESFFNVKREDVHGDRNQTISLVPPEDDEEDDDQPRFKGFFKKKK